jgi:hypothetical protein
VQVKDDDPETIQFEDPLNYTATYAVAGIDFITIANNHQFDFGCVWLRTLINPRALRPPWRVPSRRSATAWLATCRSM